MIFGSDFGVFQGDGGCCVVGVVWGDFRVVMGPFGVFFRGDFGGLGGCWFLGWFGGTLGCLGLMNFWDGSGGV